MSTPRVSDTDDICVHVISLPQVALMTAISTSQREKLAGGPGGPEVCDPFCYWIPLFPRKYDSFGNFGLHSVWRRSRIFSNLKTHPQVTREMRIENEAAGSVIGKGGQKVGEIRKISGAQVNLPILPSSTYFAHTNACLLLRCTFQQKRNRQQKESER